MVKPSAGYALIMHHAVRHVGLRLEGAAPAALSFSDMARDYSHPNPADFHRVKLHEKCADNTAAKIWIIRYAASLLDGVTIDGDMVSFAPGKGFDDLSWREGKVGRWEPDARLGDAFSPLHGIFGDNIREDIGDLSELRESMKAWGWIERPQFRGIGDARTRVVLIGHRRIIVAKELGIDWEKHMDWIEIGVGDAADAERFKLAIASNIGAKKLSPNDRKRIAAHLYNDQNWSQEKIAEALTVSQQVISKDLKELPRRSNSKGGRPRKEKTDTPRIKHSSELEDEMMKLFAEGFSRAKVAEKLDVGLGTAQLAQNCYFAQAKAEKASAPVVSEPKESEPHDAAQLPASQPENHPRICPACGQTLP